MDLFQQLFNHYNQFHAQTITTNRFSSEVFQDQLHLLAGAFSIEKLGESVEGRPINALTAGSGPLKVLLWSQMHGNESTATRALLDVLRFLNQPGSFTKVQTDILEQLAICIVPMLNPDGTNRFQRRNALDVDLNRDARSFVAPESVILKNMIHDFCPDFVFNLHDQRRFYDIAGKPSTISFLAPAYDEAESVNNSRLEAMQLIALLRNQLEEVIPGQVGLYDDLFSPRAFGDYTQGTGASTVLVESGWASDDMEKEFVRKLNFCLLISAFESISRNNFTIYTETDYRNIPMNDEKLFDVLIRRATIKVAEQEYKVDIGIQRFENSIKDSNNYFSIGEVTDIGDLQEWHGFTDIDASGLTIAPGKVYTSSGINKKQELEDLLRKGYLYLSQPGGIGGKFTNLPINIVGNGFTPSAQIVIDGKANFILRDANGSIKYVVINGFLWNLTLPIPNNVNGLVLI